MVRGCHDNVKITVYFDDILNEPIVVRIGNEENHLQITFKLDGRVAYCWTKETWSKFFRDCWEDVKSLLKKIILVIASFVRKNCSLSITDDMCTLTMQFPVK